MACRITLIQTSFVMNILLMMYLCSVWYTEGDRTFADRTSSARQVEYETLMLNKIEPAKEIPEPPVDRPKQEGVLRNLKDTEVFTEDIESPPMAPGSVLIQEPPREVQESAGVPSSQVEDSPIMDESPDPPLDSLENKMYGDLKDCVTPPLKYDIEQRGSYWILKNYIPAAMTFRCDESITYTTHGDYTFLDNLDPLTSRWQGPVSVTVYAPGEDLNATIETILYMRSCMAEGIKKFVTFHIFFDNNHVPKKVPTSDSILQRTIDCAKDPPKFSNVTTYKKKKRLLYPVNIARNVAKQNVQTYFVFPSDVELYPSINFIPEFFKMLKKPDVSGTKVERVFVPPIFEVDENQPVPETKSELQQMLRTGKAIPFHKRICNQCHKYPKANEWMQAKVDPGLSVFTVGKRLKEFHNWEPIYVGTAKEPLYDERLSWEGKSDKMTQMYVLCVLDYEFHILDNAFLVHRPGIKQRSSDKTRDQIVAKQNKLIRTKINPEYRTLFGVRSGCKIW